MNSEQIFKFADAADFLNFVFESKRTKNARFSLRAWSRQLGYKNPSYLSHILKKERNISLQTAEKFTAHLNLMDDHKKYFELLVLFQNSKSVDEKNLYLQLLEQMRSKNHSAAQPLNLVVFRVISDWYHVAILELAELHDFNSDPEAIAIRLGGEVSIQNIELAIERLLKLELLMRDSSGQLKRIKDNPILFDSYVPSEAIRHFHKQMIDKAKQAIEDQPVGERDIRGSMISIRKKDYEHVREIIRRAHAEIVKYSCQGDGEALYQFNTQFFSVSKEGETL